MKRLKAGLLFYRHYAMAPLVLSVLCGYLYGKGGAGVPATIVCKLLTSAGVWYFIATLHKHRLYYYYNMHLSRMLLAAFFFATDTLLFLIAIWIIHNSR